MKHASPDQTPELETVLYLTLAMRSAELQQLPGCGRFLALAIDAGARAGWLREMERARQVLLIINPRHLLGQQPELAVALRDERVGALLRSIRRLCPLEQAELLAESAGLDVVGMRSQEREHLIELIDRLSTVLPVSSGN